VGCGPTDDVNVNLLFTHFLDLKKVLGSVTDIITMSTETVERKIIILSNSSQSTSVAKYETGTSRFKKNYGGDTHRKSS
jgi:hypothetical protein